jgi:hypothetical protein
MIQLQFSTRELTVHEQYLMEQAQQKGQSIVSSMEFICSRAEGLTEEDKNTFMVYLMREPVSELCRLMNEAILQALPTTEAAIRAVTAEFQPKLQQAKTDGSDDEWQPPDHIDG